MNSTAVVLDDVFGVSNPKPLSYIERINIDGHFRAAMRGPNAVIVYGASKQGKTALVSRYVDYAANVVVRLTPRTFLRDIYQAILRQNDIELEESGSSSEGKEGSIKAAMKWTALIPFLGSAEAAGELASKRHESETATRKRVPFNLELPQDIGELLGQIRSKKVVILENFHYLTDENQKAFAYDLRTFQEIGIKFVVLGVWREKNRMLQFNGDLVDRVTEIPVEPWTEPFLFMVAREGEKHLNIKFGTSFLKECVAAAFGSIGVFQEILKGVCEQARIFEHQEKQRQIDDPIYLGSSIDGRVQAYEARHKQSLISLAAGQKSFAGNPESGLFLPYYFVRVLLERGYDGLKNGISRGELHEAIKAIHHRPDDVRSSDMSNLLYNMSDLQAKKSIAPPIFDFDRHINMLQIVDSTFYFFIKNANLLRVLGAVETPFADGTIAVPPFQNRS